MMAFIFLLSSCQRRFDFTLAQPEDQIVNIEIICVDSWLTYDPENTATFYIQWTIDPARYDAFLKELYQVPCYRYVNDPSQAFGKNTIRVSFSDGSYELIGSATVYYETATGDWEYPFCYFDKEAFERFISDFSA